MADLDALREALTAALQALNDDDEPVPADETPADRRRRLDRQRKRRARGQRGHDADRHADMSADNTRSSADKIVGFPSRPTDPTGSGRAEIPDRKADADADRRGHADADNTRTPHDVTGPVKRCDRCGQPLADIRGQIICLECEQRDNWAPPSTPEVADYWHERMADTVRNAIPTTDQPSLEARNKRLGLT